MKQPGTGRSTSQGGLAIGSIPAVAALSGFGAQSLGEDVSPLPSSGSTAKPAPKLGRCHCSVMATRGDSRGTVSEVATGTSRRCFALFESKSFKLFRVSPSRMVTMLQGRFRADGGFKGKEILENKLTLNI